jgi:hypothetical protein
MAVSERGLRALAGMITGHRTDITTEGLLMALLSDLMSQIGRTGRPAGVS